MNVDDFNLGNQVSKPQLTNKSAKKLISVLGIDTIGLAAAAFFAEIGHCVYAIGKSDAQARTASAGLFVTDEYALGSSLVRNQSARRLRFGSDLKSQVLNSDILFLTKHACVEKYTDDVVFNEDTLNAIAEALRLRSSFLPIVLISNSSDIVEFTKLQNTLEKLSGKLCGQEFGFAVLSIPMFVGSAYEDFWQAGEVDLGVSDSVTNSLLKEFFKPIIERVSVSSLEELQMLQQGTALWQMMRVSFLSEYCRMGNMYDKAGAARAIVKILDRHCKDGPDRINSVASGWETSQTKAKQISAIVGPEIANFPFLRAVVSAAHSQILEALAFLEKLEVGRIGFLGIRDRAGDRSLSSSPFLALMVMLRDTGKITGYCDSGLADCHVQSLDANLSPVPGLLNGDTKFFLENNRFNQAKDVTDAHDAILLCSNRPSYVSAVKKMTATKPVIDLCGGLLKENMSNLTTMPFN